MKNSGLAVKIAQVCPVTHFSEPIQFNYFFKVYCSKEGFNEFNR